MCIFCLLSSFKKGGGIQTGLNCEYDGLSEVMLSLSHSRNRIWITIFQDPCFSFLQSLTSSKIWTCPIQSYCKSKSVILKYCNLETPQHYALVTGYWSIGQPISFEICNGLFIAQTQFSVRN